MFRSNVVSIITLVLVCALTSLESTSAQTQSEKARKWLEAGHLERNIEKKIQAYRAATREDSLFADAFYYLGKTYQSHENYSAAYEAFQRAFRIAQDQGNYTLVYHSSGEMAKVAFALQNLEGYERALRACIKYAPTDSHRQEYTVKLSRFLYKNNRRAEAVELLKQLQNPSETSGEVTFAGYAGLIALCDEAEKALDQGNLTLAKALLDSLQRAKPNHQSIVLRMTELNKQLRSQENEAEKEKAYSLAIQLGAERRLDEAIALLEQILATSAEYRDAALLLAQFKQARDETRRQEELQASASRAQETKPIAPTRSRTTRTVQPVTTPVARANSAPPVESKLENLSPSEEPTALASRSNPVPEVLPDPSVEAEKPEESWSQRPLPPDELVRPDDATVDRTETVHSSGVPVPYQRLAFFFLGGLALLAFATHLLVPRGLTRVLLMFSNRNWVTRYVEQRIQKWPERKELYQILANLYLKNERTDAKAVGVYKHVLNLGYSGKDAYRMVDIVKSYYTRAGAMDSDLVRLLKRYET